MSPLYTGQKVQWRFELVLPWEVQCRGGEMPDCHNVLFFHEVDIRALSMGTSVSLEVPSLPTSQYMLRSRQGR